MTHSQNLQTQTTRGRGRILVRLRFTFIGQNVWPLTRGDHVIPRFPESSRWFYQVWTRGHQSTGTQLPWDKTPKTLLVVTFGEFYFTLRCIMLASRLFRHRFCFVRASKILRHVIRLHVINCTIAPLVSYLLCTTTTILRERRVRGRLDDYRYTVCLQGSAHRGIIKIPFVSIRCDRLW